MHVAQENEPIYVFNKLLVDHCFKKLANDIVETDGHSLVFLKTRYALDNFKRLGKDFLLKQQLNNSGMIF